MSVGVLVEGFDEGRFSLMTVNPALEMEEWESVLGKGLTVAFRLEVIANHASRDKGEWRDPGAIRSHHDLKIMMSYYLALKVKASDGIPLDLALTTACTCRSSTW